MTQSSTLDVSKQHAVVQFRKRLISVELSMEEQLARGTFESVVQDFVVVPYLIDLESTNGTQLNGKKIDPARYIELRSGDLIKFGSSEFVLMQK